jgi:hypothetical protein
MTSLLKSLNGLTAYAIGVLVVWAVIFAAGYFLRGGPPGYPVLHVFGGFLLGMLSMYVATRLYSSQPILRSRIETPPAAC